MNASRLKICGVRDVAFAREAARRGIGYLGVIFAGSSPRRVTLETAREIVAATPQVRHVGVFAGQTADEIARLARAAALDVVQLHADTYTDGDVAHLKRCGFEVWRLEGRADATLLDGRDGSKTGGTGRRADWDKVRTLKAAGARVVLAGGLGPGNIAQAAATGADILDINSSLETAPGAKSPTRLDELLAQLESPEPKKPKIPLAAQGRIMV